MQQVNIVKENAFAKFSYIPRNTINMKVIEDDELLLVSTKARSDMFNIAAPKKALSKKSLSSLKDFISSNSRSGTPMSCWLYDPTDILREQLIGMGVQLDEAEIGMVLEFDKISQPDHINEDIDLIRVESTEDLHLWKGTIKQLVPGESLAIDSFFDAGEKVLFMPDSPLVHYIGVLNGIPVATSATFKKNGMIGIWDIITLPSARGIGVGSTVTYKTIIESCNNGDIVSLSATDAGKSIYERMGFSWCCDIEIYTLKG